MKKTVCLGFVLLLCPLAGYTQVSQFALWGESSLGFKDTLVFGIHPSATFCEDPALGEVNSSGPPPAPFGSYFRWVNPRTSTVCDGDGCFDCGRIKTANGPSADYRPFVSSAHVDTFLMFIQPNDVGGGYPFTLGWNEDFDAIYDTIRLDYSGDSGAFSIDMSLDSTYAITDPSVRFARIVTWGVKATPIQPVLVSPANGSTDRPVIITLSWDSLSGADYYAVECASDTLFTTLVHNDTTSFSSAEVGILAAAKNYYWRVQAVNTIGTSQWSETWSFTTRVPLMAGSGTATLDGVISVGEYMDADTMGLTIDLPKGGTVPGTLYEMNDGENLYLALRFPRDENEYNIWVSFTFFRDLTWAREGDDFVEAKVGPYTPPSFNDRFLSDLFQCQTGVACGLYDTNYGGTTDGAVGFDTSGGNYTFELSHPLRSEDTLHDFFLWPGYGQKFRLDLHLLLSLEYYAYPVYFGSFLVTPPVPSLNVEVDSRWNLVSVPLAGASYSRAILYPSAITPAYSYDPVTNTYENGDTLVPGRGYWVKFPSEDVISLSGSGRTYDTVNVDSGWNLLGSVYNSISVSEIESDPPGMMTSPFYGYHSGYFTTDTIYPGYGYWVRVGQAGEFILAHEVPASVAKPSSRIRIVPGAELPPPPPSDLSDGIIGIPDSYELNQNYPNPFNPSTQITFSVPAPGQVTLKIFDVLGQELTTLVNAKKVVGTYTVEWNASDYPSGVYFYTIVAGEFSDTKKMVLMK